MKHVFYYETMVGPVGIAERGGKITDLFFPGADDPKDVGEMTEEETPVIKEAIKQLDEYFEGARRDFDLPLELVGTDFQKAAWKGLLTIPYGQVRSYKQMAELVGNPKACRAIGLANNRNPIAIVVPCHRVIGADGKLVGYGGGLHIKEILLQLESKK